jgi:hypothetical protein
MTFITLSLFAACLLLWEAESPAQAPLVLACRASGRLAPVLGVAYRGTGRLGCYRGSERG